jgi:hypothetical protein
VKLRPDTTVAPSYLFVSPCASIMLETLRIASARRQRAVAHFRPGG